MTDRRILACIYEGTHRPIEDSFRHPVQLSVRPRIEPDPPSAPVGVPYYTVRRCRACGMEERIAHNFEWRVRPQDGEGHGN
jgi:hypothetical protein